MRIFRAKLTSQHIRLPLKLPKTKSDLLLPAANKVKHLIVTECYKKNAKRKLCCFKAEAMFHLQFDTTNCSKFVFLLKYLIRLVKEALIKFISFPQCCLSQIFSKTMWPSYDIFLVTAFEFLHCCLYYFLLAKSQDYPSHQLLVSKTSLKDVFKMSLA